MVIRHGTRTPCRRQARAHFIGSSSTPSPPPQEGRRKIGRRIKQDNTLCGQIKALWRDSSRNATNIERHTHTRICLFVRAQDLRKKTLVNFAFHVELISRQGHC
mmetsp:Transcript_24638/g.38023  ORF Transcript_24638/g.38023 Transcript_24638/m.38023 type:complete len:104 (-) Transcript_24638:141-452(-)